MKQKQCVVIFSGGLDSSICLHLAIEAYGVENVAALSFDYHQRHRSELVAAKEIAHKLGVDHHTLKIDVMEQITHCALTGQTDDIEGRSSQGRLNVIVHGRNGLFIRLAAMYARLLQANKVMIGVNETDNPDFPDCSRKYLDALQTVLKMDLEDDDFTILSPLVFLEKKDIFELAHSKKILEDLLKVTITCYRDVPHAGCGKCPACQVKHEGLRLLSKKYPDLKIPFDLIQG